ncbi:hypothetical protein [Halorussus salinus]|uniref:hypothetical protein n=1 Tax=Halorussus salinus TaxID=1364935 RepID=UPI00109314A3|nr:hypothetical protein [Halorussus salinus]
MNGGLDRTTKLAVGAAGATRAVAGRMLATALAVFVGPALALCSQCTRRADPPRPNGRVSEQRTRRGRCGWIASRRRPARSPCASSVYAVVALAGLLSFAAAGLVVGLPDPDRHGGTEERPVVSLADRTVETAAGIARPMRGDDE